MILEQPGRPRAPLKTASPFPGQIHVCGGLPAPHAPTPAMDPERQDALAEVLSHDELASALSGSSMDSLAVQSGNGSELANDQLGLLPQSARDGAGENLDTVRERDGPNRPSGLTREELEQHNASHEVTIEATTAHPRHRGWSLG
jgi:hypothetical protein